SRTSHAEPMSRVRRYREADAYRGRPRRNERRRRSRIRSRDVGLRLLRGMPIKRLLAGLAANENWRTFAQGRSSSLWLARMTAALSSHARSFRRTTNHKVFPIPCVKFVQRV